MMLQTRKDFIRILPPLENNVPVRVRNYLDVQSFGNFLFIEF